MKREATPGGTYDPIAGILTPDRRLRVFVSSSLRELAEERAAVKAAIESLRLTPILFELGARPHPPASLYRAYLRQSEIFVGIYWQSGGWLAPGSDRSGIEDEYHLARRMPRLIYVKEPAPDREVRLNGLLEQIRADADACYRDFRSASDLASLVTDDIALLITERFELSLAVTGKAHPARTRPAGNLPVPPSPLVDRADELGLLKSFLADEHVRLTALTGPGGVGKTRLAIEAAETAKHRFEDGAWLVALASVRDPQLVPGAILDALNVPSAGRSAAAALKDYLRPRQHLLVLDNFEQTMGAAACLAELVEQAPRLKILVTSRTPLHLRAEHELPLSPLAVPAERATAAAAMESPAVQLFLDRARAVRPGFRCGPEEVAAVAGIVRRLDGLPLAIELAASRCRVLAPSELLERLTAALDVGGGGLRDLPDRLRTLRAAINWSFELLDERDQRLFLRLSVFRGGFTVDGALAICPEASGADLLDALESIVDSSLVQRRSVDGQSRYFMLETVGEFADEKLVLTGLAPEVRALHAGFVGDLVRKAGLEVFGGGQKMAVRAFDRDEANVVAAMEWYLESKDAERLGELIWNVWPYWWFYGRLGEGGRRARKALEEGGCSELSEARLSAVVGLAAVWQADAATAMTFLERSIVLFRKIDDAASAATLLAIMAVAVWAVDPGRAIAFIEEARPMFARSGNAWGMAICANVVAWLSEPTDADGNPTPYAREAMAYSEASGDDLNLGMAMANIGAQELDLGQLPAAREHLAGSLRTLAGIREQYAIASTFGTVARLASATHDPATGAQMFGVAQGLREWLQVPVQPGQATRHAQMEADLRGQLASQEFEHLVEQGKLLDYESAVALAISVCEGRSEDRTEPVRSGTREEVTP